MQNRPVKEEDIVDITEKKAEQDKAKTEASATKPKVVLLDIETDVHFFGRYAIEDTKVKLIANPSDFSKVSSPELQRHGLFRSPLSPYIALDANKKHVYNLPKDEPEAPRSASPKR